MAVEAAAGRDEKNTFSMRHNSFDGTVVNRKVRTALEGLVEQPLAFCIQGPNGGIKRVAAASWAVHIKTNE